MTPLRESGISERDGGHWNQPVHNKVVICLHVMPYSHSCMVRTPDREGTSHRFISLFNVYSFPRTSFINTPAVMARSISDIHADIQRSAKEVQHLNESFRHIFPGIATNAEYPTMEASMHQVMLLLKSFLQCHPGHLRCLIDDSDCEWPPCRALL